MAADLTPEQFSKWPPISSVVADLAKQFKSKHTAVRELCSRLRDKLVLAYAGTLIWPPVHAGDPDTKQMLVLMTPKIWEALLEAQYLSDRDIWITSSHTYREIHRIHGHSVDYRFYDIRVEPDTLVGFLNKPQTALPEAQSPPLLGTEIENKGPPLSPKALASWYEAYKLAYTENERTLDHAWDRAKRAFPDKTVTRQSVRELMPSGKPGPKPKG